MQQGNAIRRKVEALRRSQETRASTRPDDDFTTAIKALEALNTAYKRVARALNDEIDRASADLAEISALGGRLRWVSERQKLVRTALQAGPGLVAYVCGDCREVPQIRSLAEMAAKLANDVTAYPTALNLLSYIDQELGWTPLPQTA